MDKAYLQKLSCHNLLLPDGRILTAGGDVWNAKYFILLFIYKNFENKTVLAKTKFLKLIRILERKNNKY